MTGMAKAAWRRSSPSGVLHGRRLGPECAPGIRLVKRNQANSWQMLRGLCERQLWATRRAVSGGGRVIREPAEPTRGNQRIESRRDQADE